MIYFMQSPTGGPIKIGHTANLRARHKALERHYGKKLEVLATAEGDRELEEIVHRKFARLRIGRTEQFWVDDELLSFIRDPVASSDLLKKVRWADLLLRYEDDACALQLLAGVPSLAGTELQEVSRICRSIMSDYPKSLWSDFACKWITDRIDRGDDIEPFVLALRQILAIVAVRWDVDLPVVYFQLMLQRSYRARRLLTEAYINSAPGVQASSIGPPPGPGPSPGTATGRTPNLSTILPEKRTAMSFQPSTPRPQKVNEDPRIAINGLMKYMDATPSQREAIIRDQKFPPPFKVTWYDAACEAASRFAAGGFSDQAIVSDALSRLRSSVPANDNEQLKNGLNIEALESLLSSFDLVDLRGLSTSPGDNVTPSLLLSGVVVNVRPEIELRGVYRKEPTAGAIKFYFSKPNPLTEEMGRYGAVLVMRHQEMVVGETASVRKKSCMVYDVFGSRVWAAPANSTARLRDLDAACREIAQRWPSITLNPRPE